MISEQVRHTTSWHRPEDGGASRLLSEAGPHQVGSHSSLGPKGLKKENRRWFSLIIIITLP